ncbi:MAG: hypothetical protein NZM28_04200, partial [Fimbriimonadales bacterium]|nr:hypothetical protein [Fimbriimonadales bacterium]
MLRIYSALQQGRGKNMVQWLDRFTGQLYQLEDERRDEIRNSLAKELAQRISSDAHESANAVARYWFTTYYERVFPLRFGRDKIQKPNVSEQDTDEQTAKNDFFQRGAPLEYEQGGKFPENAKRRTAFLEDRRYPPILPAETQPDDNKPALLIADHHLATAALLNVCLRRQGATEQAVHEARLGALLHELSDLTELQNALSQFPIALALAQYL